MSEEKMEKLIDELCEVILRLETMDDCKMLFEDLCTYQEIEQMALRMYAAKQFLEGKTYLQIIEKTKLSSATLSRISRCITHGSGGYKKFIKTENKDG